eukprot:TRINITY_DN71345_c0_g1_i1.p1 TRINITY_DN71345_c0_g1~~TRINITY_DN71345_c0_g1_i1.p1  ORF type:complete len:255 (-),score=32.41 TRINITY_DN71345_c0_g1_i1:64-828(-)
MGRQSMVAAPRYVPLPEDNSPVYGLPVGTIVPAAEGDTGSGLERKDSLRSGEHPPLQPPPRPLPVMLPREAIARPCAMGALRPPEPWILAPGPNGLPVAAIGEGAARAGPDHAPQGLVGAAVGAVAGCTLIGVLSFFPLLVLPGVGYFAAKHVARRRHTIGMVGETGRVVDVKLWKPGKHAPLTEEGYWLVASDPRDSEMDLYIRRVIADMGGWVVDPGPMHDFVQQHSGSHGLSSLRQLRCDIRAAPFVHLAT